MKIIDIPTAKQISFQGKTLCVREWEKSLGLSRGALWQRLKLGWPLERALNTKKIRRLSDIECPFCKKMFRPPNAASKYCSIPCGAGARTGAIRKMKHGHSKVGAKNKLYLIWEAMRARCVNPNNKLYHRYGGRGIKVCERWDDFTKFLTDMGERPEGMTLDRRDNDGNYEPDNCRWATRMEQVHNSTVIKRITFNGKSLRAIEWEQLLGLAHGSLLARLKMGWTLERALTEVNRYVRLRNHG